MLILRAEDILGRSGFHLGETQLLTDAVTFRHAHDFYELFLVTQGRVAHMLRGDEQRLDEGALCLVRPEDEHCFRRLGKKPARFVNLAFPEAAYRRALSLYAADAPPPQARTAVLAAPVSRAMELRMRLLPGGGGVMQLAPGPLLLSLLIDALNCLGVLGQSGPDAPPNWLADAMRAMRDGDNARQGIARLVALCGRTQEHVGRTMRRCCGTTPSEFVNAIRLAEAARLLKTSGMSVIEIQLECGFDSASHFHQRFRREYLMSPARYRKLNRTVIDPQA